MAPSTLRCRRGARASAANRRDPARHLQLLRTRPRLPEDPLAAAGIVRDGQTTAISVGSANGRVFLVHELRTVPLGDRGARAAQEPDRPSPAGRGDLGLITALRPHPHYRLKLGIGDEAMRRVSSMVYFGANPLQNAELGVGGADTPESGLAVFVLRPMTRWQVLVTTCHALFGHVADSESIGSSTRRKSRSNVTGNASTSCSTARSSTSNRRWWCAGCPMLLGARRPVIEDDAQALQDDAPPATMEPAA